MKETLTFTKGDGALPAEQLLPPGYHKYIHWVSQTRLVIAKGAPEDIEHIEFRDGDFDIHTDDAGIIDVRWQWSKEKIDLKVKEMVEELKSRGMTVDMAQYQEQLERNFGRTTVSLFEDCNAETLRHFSPNQVSREATMSFLAELFPDAMITKRPLFNAP